MKFLILNTHHNQQIKIQFLENTFVEKFTSMLFKKLNNTNTYISYQAARTKPYLNFNQEAVTKYQNNLIDVIHSLNHMSLNFPVTVNELSFTDADYKKERQLLNDLHRYFVTAERTFWDKELDQGYWKYNNYYPFKKPTGEDRKKFFKLLHSINRNVHDIEEYYIGRGRRSYRWIGKYGTHHDYIIEFLMSDTTDKKEMIEHFSPILAEDYKYFSNDLDNDVWLPYINIHGKDYIGAYFDYDNPTAKDVHDARRYTGSFIIGDGKKMLSRPEMQEYFEFYGIIPQPVDYGMPLGKIVSGKEFIRNLPKNNGIKEIYGL